MNEASAVSRGEVFAMTFIWEAVYSLCRLGVWPMVQYGCGVSTVIVKALSS
jgi:hypothetical protein